MQLDQITTLFDASPVMRLLRADSAPVVIDFLNGAFKQSGTLSIGHEDLKQGLLIYLEQLHETDPECMTGPVDRYLVQWSDNAWLNRHLTSSSSEPQYQLTRHAEDAIQFVDLLISRRTGLVGTESRLRLIIDTLTDLVHGASSDPDKRLAWFEEQKDLIQRQIDALHFGQPVDVYKPSQVREKFQLAVGLLKTLQSDFRAVEERFQGIAMRVQQEQQAALETRGEILGRAMDSEDLLKTEDEGISFYAFIAFLFSPDGQQTLRQTIDEVTRLEAIQEDRESIARLRTMVRSLLQEADKVLTTNGRLSTSLKKLLNVDSAEDRRQTAEVLRDIRQFAVSLRNQTVTDELCQVTVQTPSGVASPFSRTFWTTPQTFQNQPEDHIIDLERTALQQSTLASLEFLDLECLRRQVNSLTQSSGNVTLEQLIDAFPPESGIMELVGYFQIAFEDGHSINRDMHSEITVIDGVSGDRTRVRVPLVVFRGQSNVGQTEPRRPGKPR
ncbi:DUF3375 family protein [bacterium]|nr:DUF3375 family protein [bacterium]